jgi:hypothetical protein
MKKTQYLIRLGEALSNKYASVDANSIKEEIKNDIFNDIKNAAASGPQGQGIMNFLPMIQQDGTTLRFDVFRNDTLGAKKIRVYNFTVSKPEFAPKYQDLPNQIQDYLSKYPDLFQYKHNGEDVVYNNFVLNLTYEPVYNPGDQIAGN